MAALILLFRLIHMPSIISVKVYQCVKDILSCRLSQGEPSCRRSALLKDDSLLEFYYDDTRTAYDMFQRGMRIAGEHTHHFLITFM